MTYQDYVDYSTKQQLIMTIGFADSFPVIYASLCLEVQGLHKWQWIRQ